MSASGPSLRGPRPAPDRVDARARHEPATGVSRSSAQVPAGPYCCERSSRIPSATFTSSAASTPLDWICTVSPSWLTWHSLWEGVPALPSVLCP